MGGRPERGRRGGPPAAAWSMLSRMRPEGNTTPRGHGGGPEPDRRRLLARGAGALLMTVGAGAVGGCAAGPAAGPEAGATPAASPAGRAGAAPAVHVVATAWHAGLAFPRAALGPGQLPEAADLAAAPVLEAGWGDRRYYPDRGAGLADALAAGLVPSDAVLHLAGYDAVPAPQPDRRVWALPLDGAGLARLLAAIHAAVDRPAQADRAAPVAPGLTANSRFYPAHGRFHLFNTCNTWVARRLADAGLAIDPSGVVTADDLAGRLARLPGVRALPLRE